MNVYFNPINTKMKKILFTVAVAAMLGFCLSSCKKEGAKCYEVTYTAHAAGGEAHFTLHLWLTDEEKDAQRKSYEASNYTEIIFTELSDFKSYATCIAFSTLTENDMQCWKVTYNANIGGVVTTVTSYQWCTEAQIKTQITGWEKLGYTDIKYEPATSFTTADDCYAQNSKQ